MNDEFNRFRIRIDVKTGQAYITAQIDTTGKEYVVRECSPSAPIYKTIKLVDRNMPLY